MVFIKVILLLLFAMIAYSADLSTTQSKYGFGGKFPDETEAKVSGKFKSRGLTVVLNALRDNRYGLSDTQYGGDIYSPLGKDTWGYISVNSAPNSNFLARLDYATGVYHGIGSGVEVGLSYKRMIYPASYTDIFKLSGSYYTPLKNVSLSQSITHVPKDSTFSFTTGIVYDDENFLKMYYSYGFGDSAEDFGFRGIQTIQHSTHIAGAKVKVSSEWTLGGEVMKETYQGIYDKSGGGIFAQYSW